MEPRTTLILTSLLWTLGALISGFSLAMAVMSGMRDCEQDVACSMDSAIEMLFSVTGVFVGALVIVGGFALRTSQRRRQEDLRQRQQMREILDLIAQEKGSQENTND